MQMTGFQGSGGKWYEEGAVEATSEQKRYKKLQLVVRKPRILEDEQRPVKPWLSRDVMSR